ncbi:hypothetical protein Tco_1126147 [Tanacetum coccineum]
MGGSYYPIPCSILSTGKNRKTPQRYANVQTTSWRIFIRSLDSRTIDQSAGGKLHDLNAEESWALLEDLALYDNESWNDPRDFAKPVKAIALPQDVPSISDRRLIELKKILQPMIEIKPQQPEEPELTLEDKFKDLHLNLPILEVLAHAPIYNAILDQYVESLQLGKNGSAFVQGEIPANVGDPGLFTLPCRLGDSKPFDTLVDLGSCIVGCQNSVGEGESTRESYKPQPSSDGIGAKPPYYARKDFLDCHFPGEWEISRDAELNSFKDTLVFRRMVEFLRAIPINLKCNTWESEDLIKKPINWDKPPKNRDGAWHAKIRLIKHDGEEFTKTLQSIPTTKKLSERESSREIIDLDHFYDT